MISALSLLLAAQFQEGPVQSANRLDLANRLMMVDEQWMRCKDEKRRRQATPQISSAVNAFFGGRFNSGCEWLDKATISLTGKTRMGQNFSTQISGLLADTQQDVRTYSKKLYEDDTVPQNEPLEVKQKRLGNLNRYLEDGHKRLLNQVTRVDSLSVLLDKYGSSQNPDIREWTKRMRSFTVGKEPEYYENVREEWKALQRAVEDPKPTNIWYSVQGRTKFHVRWPRRFDKNNVTLVVGLHGAGGSPAMFIKTYGAGVCVTESNRRGWVFMSPDSTPDAPRDCMNWLEQRGMKVGKLVVMGHSMGGGNTIAYAASNNRKPDAVGLFAPAPRAFPRDMSRIPTYLTVGTQEMANLKSAAMGMADQGKNWPMFVYEEADPCEHLMIVASRAKEAFQFFEKALRR
jgi:hypothetical protein